MEVPLTISTIPHQNATKAPPHHPNHGSAAGFSQFHSQSPFEVVQTPRVTNFPPIQFKFHPAASTDVDPVIMSGFRAESAVDAFDRDLTVCNEEGERYCCVRSKLKAYKDQSSCREAPIRGSDLNSKD